MRKALLYLLVLITGLLFLGRLFYLQIIDDSFKQQSESNAYKKEYNYPERGHIYDRNGKLLVANQRSYDFMAIPRNVKPFDTLELCELLNITPEKLNKQLHKAKVYSPRLPSPIVSQLSKIEHARLQEKIRKFKGFYIQKRSARHYQTTIGANVLGYIAEVNPKKVKENPYYQPGDLEGKTGIEKSYEEQLRGIKGVRYIQKDRFNRDIGAYQGGRLDTLPINGKDINITIDAVLQEYGERLMNNKRGGIVAIEPNTGEILALVSAPSYNPALMVGRQRSKNFTKFYLDTIARPLFDRGLQATYPPGSPFKLLNALIGLEEGVITPQTRFTCRHGFKYSRTRNMGCHCSYGASNDLNKGIFASCNAYFGNTYKKTIDKYGNATNGIKHWSDHVKSFGLGNYLGYDLSIGSKGNVPDTTFYNKWYGKNKWFTTYTISNAIGQGEILTTPIQLANMTAAIANRGYYYTPHIIKNIANDTIPKKFTSKKITTISKENFEPVIQGMFNVYEQPGGTGYYSRIKGIEICGKTGTAEVYGKINGERKQLTDHSIFVAFAPKDNPKIAMAVFVEHGYWGGRWAAPMASLMIEKYLRGSISRNDLETKMLNGSLQEEYDKYISGEEFTINK
ncbi:penicillin-binding protein 2 [Pseudofulvibacter geojedonensis]|uniref:Penicillin-binding protein 2 n=1 Tax=Pseudofulvibacter geojedonensis TaxID=1123758 RepID=A0ABW3I3C9_9FLAO